MTDVALKEYLERLIDSHDRRYEQRFAAMALALEKAEAILRERERANSDVRLVVLSGSVSMLVSVLLWWFLR